MKRARLIDISKWQISFEFLGNVDGVIVKASEGWDIDPCFQDFLPEVMRAPIRGAYHYYRTETDPVRQAEIFLLQSLKGDFHFLAVDYESSNNTLDRAGAEGLLKMLKYLRAAQPLPVFIYTNSYIYRDNLRVWNEEFDTFPLWIARWKYSDAEVADPTRSLAGDDLERSWDIWQWTSTGDGAMFGVGSVCVDLNVYNGTVEEMRSRFIKESTDMKKWYQSKTLWFSLVFIITAIAGLFGYGDWTPDTQLVEYVQLGMGVLMAILRLLTTKGIEP